MAKNDELFIELSKILNKDQPMNKTAAKKKEKEDEMEEDKKEEKPKKHKKNKKAFSDVLANLVKLAEELENTGAKEAAELVDNALEILVANLKKDDQ